MIVVAKSVVAELASMLTVKVGQRETEYRSSSPENRGKNVKLSEQKIKRRSNRNIREDRQF
jgi:vancomycin resistance protein YoaR